MLSSCCPQMVEGTRNLSGASFIRAPISFMRALPHELSTPPKFPSPNIITVGDYSTYEFEGDTNIQPIVPPINDISCKLNLALYSLSN